MDRGVVEGRVYVAARAHGVDVLAAPAHDPSVLCISRVRPYQRGGPTCCRKPHRARGTRPQQFSAGQPSVPRFLFRCHLWFSSGRMLSLMN